MSSENVKLFISYSRADSIFVDRLQADLQSRNFEAWVDRRKLEAGRDWAESIERAIDRSQVALIILSPDSLKSDWVKKEYSYAQDRGKAIIPIKLRAISKIPIRLNELQNISFETDYNSSLNELMRTLTRLSIPHASEMLQKQLATPYQGKQPGSPNEAEVITPRPAPPLPNAALNELYKAGVDAKASGDLDRTVILWQQILDNDPNFGNGIVVDQMPTQQDLVQLRIHRLEEKITQASRAGDWRQATGAWNALLGVKPDDPQIRAGLLYALQMRVEQADREGAWGEEIGALEAILKFNPQDSQAKLRIGIAETNQQWAWQYTNAQEFVAAHKSTAAIEALTTLWGKAPYYGDPAGLTQFLGIPARETYSTLLLKQAQTQAAAEAQARTNKQLQDYETRKAEWIRTRRDLSKRYTLRGALIGVPLSCVIGILSGIFGGPNYPGGLHDTLSVVGFFIVFTISLMFSLALLGGIVGFLIAFGINSSSRKEQNLHWEIIQQDRLKSGIRA